MTARPQETEERGIKWIELVIVLASITIIAVLVSPAVRPNRNSSPKADSFRPIPNVPATSNVLAFPASQGFLAGDPLSPRLDGSNFVGTDPGEGNPTLFLNRDGRLTNPMAIPGGFSNLVTNLPPGMDQPFSAPAPSAGLEPSGAASNRVQSP